MITHVQNYGQLDENQIHELDCKLDEVFEKVYVFDPQPCYQIKTDDEGNTIVEYENGFEHYLVAYYELVGV